MLLFVPPPPPVPSITKTFTVGYGNSLRESAFYCAADTYGAAGYEEGYNLRSTDYGKKTTFTVTFKGSDFEFTGVRNPWYIQCEAENQYGDYVTSYQSLYYLPSLP